MASAEYQREYRQNNLERVRESVREGVRRWRARNPELTKERYRLDKNRRRARIAEARIDRYIQLKKLHNWESKACGICSEPITDKYHIDHIIPLSRGGEHSEANLQLAHPYCNQSKFNRLPSNSGMV